VFNPIDCVTMLPKLNVVACHVKPADMGQASESDTYDSSQSSAPRAEYDAAIIGAPIRPAMGQGCYGNLIRLRGATQPTVEVVNRGSSNSADRADNVRPAPVIRIGDPAVMATGREDQPLHLRASASSDFVHNKPVATSQGCSKPEVDGVDNLVENRSSRVVLETIGERLQTLDQRHVWDQSEQSRHGNPGVRLLESRGSERVADKFGHVKRFNAQYNRYIYPRIDDLPVMHREEFMIFLI